MSNVSISRASLIQILAERTNTPKAKIDVILGNLTDIAEESLRTNQVFTLPNIAQFCVHITKPRKGKPIDVMGQKVPGDPKEVGVRILVKPIGQIKNSGPRIALEMNSRTISEGVDDAGQLSEEDDETLSEEDEDLDD